MRETKYIGPMENRTTNTILVQKSQALNHSGELGVDKK